MRKISLNEEIIYNIDLSVQHIKKRYNDFLIDRKHLYPDYQIDKVDSDIENVLSKYYAKMKKLGRDQSSNPLVGKLTDIINELISNYIRYVGSKKADSFAKLIYSGINSFSKSAR